MLITEKAGTLQPALAADLRAEHLPQLPAWYPLPDAEQPLTPGERAAVRRARAVTEATAGPFDGNRVTVHCPNDRPPASMPMLDGEVVYSLDERASRPDWLVYRYDPARSLLHRKLMTQVEDAFREAGPDYIETARTDDAQHHGITVERMS